MSEDRFKAAICMCDAEVTRNYFTVESDWAIRKQIKICNRVGIKSANDSGRYLLFLSKNRNLLYRSVG